MPLEGSLPDDILVGALERFDDSQSATSLARDHQLEDVKFGRLGDQWPDHIAKQRKEESRPVLTINRMPSFIRQVVNEARQNKPSITVHPVDNGADEETADVINGLVRSIERNSSADIAYDTAIDHAVSGGFGFFRIGIDFAHDETFNMQAFIKRVPNPLMVHWDPNSTEFDASDWEFAFVSEFLTEDEFERQWPKAAKVSFEGGDSRDDVLGHWLEGDKVRVAEYWLREHGTRVLLMLRGGDKTIIAREDRLPMLAKQFAAAGGFTVDDLSDDDLARFYMETLGLEEVRRRDVEFHTVKRRMISGAEVLDEEDWPGSMIPICPVWGDEVIVDGERHFRSMIRDARDPQIMFNFWRSSTTELVALAPRAPWVGAEDFLPDDQTEAAKWLTANTRSHAYLLHSAQAQPPQRTPFAGVPAGALQEALNAADDMKAVIGIFDAGLGARSNETSGRAILARQREGDVSNFHFIDNLARAIRYAGEVLVEIIPAVYSAQETIRILGEDEAESVIKLTQEAGGGEVKDGKRELYNLTIGVYDVTVSSGPNFATQREETRETLVDIMRAVPGAGAVIGDLLMDVMDFQGADKLAKRLKFLLPPEIRQAEDQEGLEDVPDEAKAMVQRAQQTIGQLQAQLQEAQQAAEETQTDGEAKLTKAQADIAEGQRQFVLDVDEAKAEAAFKGRELDIKAAELDIKRSEAGMKAKEMEQQAFERATEVETRMQTEAEMQELAEAMMKLATAIAQGNEVAATQHAEIIAALTAPKQVSLDRDRQGNLVGGTTTLQ